MTSVPNVECRKLKLSIEKELERMLTLLETTKKDHMVFYNYSSEKELMKAQKIFIDLGHKTMNYLK